MSKTLSQGDQQRGFSRGWSQLQQDLAVLDTGIPEQVEFKDLPRLLTNKKQNICIKSTSPPPVLLLPRMMKHWPISITIKMPEEMAQKCSGLSTCDSTDRIRSAEKPLRL